MAVATFTAKGTKATSAVTLDKNIFNVDVPNHQLLKDAYQSYLANGRESLAVTKTRGLVRGGGRKPWKQKGTGRARFGSSRVPLWRGGGITFGPTGNENYQKRINVKAKRIAIKQALSLKNKENKVIVLDSFDASGKTKDVAALLSKVGANRRILLVVDNKDKKAEQSTRNLPEAKLVQANYMNVFDVLNADSIVVTKPSLKILSDWLGGAK